MRTGPPGRLAAVRSVHFVPGRWGDAAWAGLMAVYALHVGITGDGGFVHGNVVRSAIGLLTAECFLLLRRESVYAYCVLAAVVFAAVDFYVPLTAAAFALGVTNRGPGARGRSPAVAVLLALAAGVLGGYRQASVECPAVVVDPLVLPCGFLEAAYRSAAAILAAYALGAYLRRSEEMRSLNRRLAREGDRNAERARLGERTRIAGEMHDLLGHHLALTGIYAGALALKSSVSPELNRMARVVVESNTTAAQTLHRVVRVLRQEPSEDSASARDMAALVTRVRATGSEVTVTAPRGWDGFDALPAPARRAFCRVLQEAVTNIVKHAPGAPVSVCFLREEDEVALTVRNGPAGVAPEGGAPAGGFGLVGLEERMSVLGGLFRAGPEPEGGFRVHAALPLRHPFTNSAGLSEQSGTGAP